MTMTLKAARVNKGLTQAEAAKKLGVSRDTIINWEAGNTFPQVKHIKEIEAVYGVNFSEINFLIESKST